MVSISDKEFYQLNISINKALNPIEAPLKLKHARSAIISTHRTKEAKSFWTIITRQPLMENRFTAWKFCHLLHKVLRDGHFSTIQYSQIHKKMILEMGKLWGHLNDGVGNCIQSYTKLLVTKIDFHDKNPNFPGNLMCNFGEIVNTIGVDINVYFQLGVEIFDYLDEILDVQSTVFTSVNMYRMSSMTPQGQCRLAPLIPLIQDSNPLYDLCVRLMFKLHVHLPNDILVGHRDRFRTMFNLLKKFYDSVRPLQYFADLIQVPHLPENAPNFSSKVDFGSYIPPVVVVPADTEPNVDNLVDNVESEESAKQTIKIDFEKLLQHRDDIIRELQSEIERLRSFITSLTGSHREEGCKMREKIFALNLQLTDAQESFSKMRVLKDDLELVLQSTPKVSENGLAEEKKGKAAEEKFFKLKNMYTQIRDEHINLLRQHGDTTKKLNEQKKQCFELTAENQKLTSKLKEFTENRNDDLKNQAASLEYKNKEMSVQYEQLRASNEELQMRCNILQTEIHTEAAKLKHKNEELDELNEKQLCMDVSLKKLTDKLEIKTLECQQLQRRYDEVSRNKDYIILDLERKNTEIIHQTESLSQENALLNQKYSQVFADNENLKTQQNSTQNELEKIINEKNYEILQHIKNHVEHVEATKTELLCNSEKMLEISKQKEDELIIKDKEIENLKINSVKVDDMYKEIVKASKSLRFEKATENYFTSASKSSTTFLLLAENTHKCLNELATAYDVYYNNNREVASLAKKVIQIGHLLATIQIQGIAVCYEYFDIDSGQEIVIKIKELSDFTSLLFDDLHNLANTKNVSTNIVNIKDKLNHLTTTINDTSIRLDSSERIEDLVESELAFMDKAINEAADKIVEMLSNARRVDSGIKLEVNEKILDACTQLMESIRVLIQKSMILQAEIISIGKGNTSKKDFYKRNSQWTEGLISASKNIATSANLLVQAANKAVSGGSNHNFDIIVAAQDIAACTAQLVVASRVKAPHESQKLCDLSVASRNVTQATAAVVATAKDCNQQLEYSQDMDLSRLSVHQAKTLEMEIQVKVLQLEQLLQVERLRLSAFRRNNYQNTDI